jgi:outer membrane lipoprotein
MVRNLFILIIFLSTLGGCASNIPLEIREDIADSKIPINTAAADIDQYQGKKVRWGGTITAVENRENDTWIEVVGRELNSWGEPMLTDETEGRFLVRIEGFLDPAIYKVERGITVYGTIESRIVRQIDDHPYTYPLIKAQSYYLWSDYDRRRYYGYPYYPYHPYYYHYYPYRYGFYPRYHFGLHHYYW